MPFYMFVVHVAKYHRSFLYLHFSLIVAKIRTLIRSANNRYLALVSGGSQVYIVLHEEEADEHSIIKMFPAAW